MGLYDRDYAYDREPGFHLDAPKSLTTQLVLFTACVYALQLFIKGFTSWFNLPDTWYLQPWSCFRLLTYGFLHDPNDFQHVLINMFVLWMFGRELESKYGRREFLWFYLWSITFAGFVWAVSEAATAQPAVLVGASGGVTAAVALFALNFPHRKILLFFLIPMPMWIAAVLGLLWDVNLAMSRSGHIAAIAHLAGALCGLYYYKFHFSPGRWLADRFSGLAPRAKPKLQIHEPTDHNPAANERVDEILKKIQEQGQGSLTWRERRTLEKASQEYQKKRDE